MALAFMRETNWCRAFYVGPQRDEGNNKQRQIEDDFCYLHVSQAGRNNNCFPDEPYGRTLPDGRGGKRPSSGPRTSRADFLSAISQKYRTPRACPFRKFYPAWESRHRLRGIGVLNGGAGSGAGLGHRRTDMSRLRVPINYVMANLARLARA